MEKERYDYLQKKVWAAVDRYFEKFDAHTNGYVKSWTTTEYNVTVRFSRIKEWGGCEVLATVKFNGEVACYCYLDMDMNWEGNMWTEKKH